jgi:hypothetical protein
MQRASLTLLLLLTLIWEGGCTSPKSQANRELQLLRDSIRQVQTASLSILEDLATLPPSPPLLRAQENTRTIQTISQKAQRHVDTTQRHIGDLQDPVPWWARLLQNLFVASILLLILVLLVYLGIGALSRPLARRMGHLIRTSAHFDRKALFEGKATEIDHRRISALRAAAPEYDQLFREI